jgi:hypothetical protein
MTAPYAGPDTGFAYTATTPGRWWNANPISTSTYPQTLDAIVYVPFWPGPNTRLTGVHISLAIVADTAGNVLRFAVYDSDDNWTQQAASYPKAKIAEIPGEVATTTTRTNEARVLDCDIVVPRFRPLWMGVLVVGGTSPTTRTCNGGHPFVSPGYGSALTGGYYATGQVAFPAVVTGGLSGTQVPHRLMIKMAA